MEILYARYCGLDVHRNMVVACLSIIEAGQRRKEIRTFRTVTKELLAMREWLLSESCSHVGMESTGVLWRPVYDRVAGYFELVLVKAAHMRQVPGHKTDAHCATRNLPHGEDSCTLFLHTCLRLPQGLRTIHAASGIHLSACSSCTLGYDIS